MTGNAAWESCCVSFNSTRNRILNWADFPVKTIVKPQTQNAKNACNLIGIAEMQNSNELTSLVL